MNRTHLCAALAAAALAAAACKGGGAGNAATTDPAATQPAGTQPAPTAQHEAAPQTGANMPPADSAEAPSPGWAERAKQPHFAAGQTYGACMAKAKAASADERPLLERSCAGLPGAPK